MRALLIPPQESKFWAVFDLRRVDLKLITSGWHRLVIAAPRRVFVFPRNDGEVDQLEREAEALPAAVDLPFAPQLHGRHLDQGISRYPFLEMTRVEGTPYELVAGELSFEIAARLLETLGRKIAQLHDRVRCRDTWPRGHGS